ncbi:transcriptional repressor [bacterium]|nr:transcriptional repressor [bacterium]MBU3956541.1 transcriptional repressor [bacterium]MBU4134664.1 transcriptional repressor [bacterium]
MNKEIENKFCSYLRSNGMRCTAERKIILREVFAIHRHFDTEDLFRIVHRKKTGISHASVYRTLPLLVKAGLVSRTAVAAGKAVYEHVYGHRHHDHMMCIRCGKYIEFTNDKIEKLQLTICAEYEFKPTYHTLQIKGLCRNCAQKVKRRKQR